LIRYQAGEELTFDYGLLNDAVLAFYGDLLLPLASWVLNRFSLVVAGIPTPDCRGLRR
jgi:hypothetical protein